jgi:hypothetical protein
MQRTDAERQREKATRPLETRNLLLTGGRSCSIPPISSTTAFLALCLLFGRSHSAERDSQSRAEVLSSIGLGPGGLRAATVVLNARARGRRACLKAASDMMLVVGRRNGVEERKPLRRMSM